MMSLLSFAWNNWSIIFLVVVILAIIGYSGWLLRRHLKSKNDLSKYKSNVDLKANVNKLQYKWIENYVMKAIYRYDDFCLLKKNKYESMENQNKCFVMFFDSDPESSFFIPIYMSKNKYKNIYEFIEATSNELGEMEKCAINEFVSPISQISSYMIKNKLLLTDMYFGFADISSQEKSEYLEELAILRGFNYLESSYKDVRDLINASQYNNIVLDSFLNGKEKLIDRKVKVVPGDAASLKCLYLDFDELPTSEFISPFIVLKENMDLEDLKRLSDLIIKYLDGILDKGNPLIALNKTLRRVADFMVFYDLKKENICCSNVCFKIIDDNSIIHNMKELKKSVDCKNQFFDVVW